MRLQWTMKNTPKKLKYNHKSKNQQLGQRNKKSQNQGRVKGRIPILNKVVIVNFKMAVRNRYISSLLHIKFVPKINYHKCLSKCEIGRKASTPSKVGIPSLSYQLMWLDAYLPRKVTAAPLW